MNPTRFALATFALASCLLLACAGNEVDTEPRQHQFAVSAQAELAIKLQSGSVTVRGGSESAVRIDAVLRDPSRVSYAARQEGERVLVESTVEGTSLTDVVAFRVSRGADLTITAPAATRINIETLAGSIELHDLTAGGDARTGNGKVRLEGVSGGFNVTTRNGSIEAARVQGQLAAESGDGLVSLLDSSGAFQAKTAYGRLFFQGSLSEGSQSHFESADGRVSVQIKSARSLTVDAAGSTVALTAPPSFQTSRKTESRVEGSLGDMPRTSLSVRAGNGAVDLTLME